MTPPPSPPHQPAAAPAAGDLVRFVEPAGRRRARVGTVERRIARGRHVGAMVVRVAGEARRYVLPADRLRSLAPAPAPASPPAPVAAPGDPMQLFE